MTLTLLVGLALLGGSTLGCHDSAPSAPGQTLDNRSGSGVDGIGGGSGGGSDADSSEASPPPPNTHAPALPSGPTSPDTAVQPPPPPSAFTLEVTVLGAISASDSARAVRLPRAAASLYRVKTADGAALEPEVLVGTAVADENGELAFRDLPSAYYRLDVVGPAGGPYASASRAIPLLWSTPVGVYVVLPRKS